MPTRRPRRALRPERRRFLATIAALGLAGPGLAPRSAQAQAFDLGALTALLGRVRSGEATFVETRRIEMLDRTLHSSGRLSFKAPDSFVRETLKPRHEKLAVDGNTVTMSQGERSRTMQLDASPEAAVIVEAVRGTLTGNRATLERLFETTVARSVRGATRTIAVSNATAGDVEHFYGVGEQRVRVVPNGVDARFAPGDRDAARAAVRERWGIEAPFVLHVGSNEPRKGIDVLVEAAALARTSGANWRVVLAGSPGFQGERIEAAARASGACDLLGPVDDEELLDLLRAAGAFAAPALYEGFGIAPLEAMACGVPAVIAADSGGLEEVSGPAALVVSERSAEAWRRALERALGQPGEWVERGLAHAAKFRWPAVAAQTRTVLAEAAGA